MSAADGFVQVPPDSSGSKIDHSALTVAGAPVLRQRAVFADPVDPLALASVLAAPPNPASAYGVSVRSIVTDGLDATQGSIADAAVTTDTNATVSAKLRGLVKILGDVWDSGNHLLKVSIAGALAAGSAIIGKVGIDQTTPGTTNKVSIGTDGSVAITGGVAVSGTLAISNFPGTQTVSGSVQLSAGSAVIGHVITDSGSTTAVTGTVQVSNTQLPAALGPQPSASSMSITFPSDFGGLIVDMTVAVQTLLELISNPVQIETTTGRMRVVLDATGGAQTLANVTTVATVSTVTTVTTVTSLTNIAQVGSSQANSMVSDAMNNAYANQVLRCIS